MSHCFRELERQAVNRVAPTLPHGAYKRVFYCEAGPEVWWVVDKQNGPHDWSDRVRRAEVWE